MNQRPAVLAIGGNSLIKDQTKIAMWYQYEALKETVAYLADLIEEGNLGADTFIFTTAVDAVYLNFGEANQRPLGRVTAAEIKQYLGEGHFKPGSMKPKMEAVLQFLDGGGEKAIISSPETLFKAVRGEAGTTITK